MLTPALRALLAAASKVAARNQDGDAPAVAAAVLTRAGEIITGLNTAFSKGTCAEIVALSDHAARWPADPIIAVVAVYGPSGNVISLCGKCRQVLFDNDPAIECIIRDQAGLHALPVKDLLPHAFNASALDDPQIIWMWAGYEALVRSGAKTQTIRVDDPFRIGPAVIAFATDAASVRIRAQVTAVRHTVRDALTSRDAQRDGFATLGELQAALDKHYPHLDQAAPLDIVSFALLPPAVENIGE